jgi:hypothetical protein
MAPTMMLSKSTKQESPFVNQRVSCPTILRRTFGIIAVNEILRHVLQNFDAIAVEKVSSGKRLLDKGLKRIELGVELCL